MKKSVILLLIVVLLIFPLVQAQTYSGLNRFTDNVKLFFSSDKVNLALEIREKEVDSAIENFQNENTEATNKNLEKAYDKLQVVQEKVSLDNSEEIKTSVDEIIDKINEEEDLSDEFDDYLLEEEKTQLTAVLTEKTFEYCEELAKEDFALMLKEEECNPETAPAGLEKELAKLKDLQYRMFVQLMLEIRSCIDDPGTCNCEANVDINEKAKCEKMVALAVKCEYKDDEASCNELEAMKPSPGDGFARSFVPDFLMNLFAEKYEMIEYGVHPSNKVPKECQNYNTKPECRQYDDLKENNLDWDEYGNYRPILHPDKKPSRGGTDETPPTIQESVPECFDEKGMFLEECGEINIVWTEDGWINYIVEKQIDDVIKEFENKSAQHTIDVGGEVIDEVWTIDEGELKVSNKAKDIKKDMNQIKNQIQKRTYAPGTEPGGVVDGDDMAPQGIMGNQGDGSNGNGGDVVDNNVAGDGGDDGVVTDDMTVDAGPVDSEDSGSNDVAGVDPGPDGIVGIIEGTGEPGPGD